MTDAGNHTLPGLQEQPPSVPVGVMLVGFRATGKSTVGRMVAERLGLRFLDMDELLVGRYGPIDRQVAEGGWSLFREREQRLLAELAAEDGVVVATGGGAVLHKDLWPRIKRRFLVVWLHAPEQVIGARLAADERTAVQRPSLTGKDPLSEIASLLDERRPLYQAACHVRVDGAQPAQEVAERIVALCRAGGQGRGAAPDA